MKDTVNLCKNCKNFSQILIQKKDYKFCWQKECTLYDCRLLPAMKKCNGKYFEITKKPSKTMKVVKMEDYENVENYLDCQEQNNFKEFWDCVKKFLIDKKIKYTGSWHQNWEYGVPIIEYNGKLYAFAVTMRRWGLIIAEAFYPENKDPMAYLDWAFGIPKSESMDLDENKDPLLSTEGN